ncbi:MAG TPA: polysaccharide biosynthesis/export family protein [Terriglobia bacterium]|nr:polysaccharide biosynthesis/export family protein [Terriglobia bacterium]
MKRINLRGLEAMLVVLLMAGLGQTALGQKKKQAGKSGATPAAASTEQKTGDVDASTYVIGPEDVLDINVWKEPDITRSVPVRPDGKISVPLLNDIQASGLTPMQLQESIKEGLKKFISEPQVTVIVKEINSRRIFVLGEVTRPGAFAMLPNMTVLQALSSAGGFSQYAKLNGIYVMRTENGRQSTFPFNYKEVIRGKNSQQNIMLKPGDTIVVP